MLCSIDVSWIDKAMEMGEHRTPESLYVDTKGSLVIEHADSCDQVRNEAMKSRFQLRPAIFQVIPLLLRIYFPLIKLSTNRIEFGTVRVGDSKRIVLSIENISSLYRGTDNHPDVQDLTKLIF